MGQCPFLYTFLTSSVQSPCVSKDIECSDSMLGQCAGKRPNVLGLVRLVRVQLWLRLRFVLQRQALGLHWHVLQVPRPLILCSEMHRGTTSQGVASTNYVHPLSLSLSHIKKENFTALAIKDQNNLSLTKTMKSRSWELFRRGPC